MTTNEQKETKKNPKAVSEIQVSEGTAKYIRLKEKLSDLWNSLYDAIDEDYGDVDKVFDKDIYPHLVEVDRVIERYLIYSICERMGDIGVENLI